AGVRVPVHPGGEVLHAGDVQAGEDLGVHGVVVEDLTGHERVAEVAPELAGEGVGEPLGDDVLPDGDGRRVPGPVGVPEVVVELVDGDRLDALEDLRGGPDVEPQVPGDAAVG